ncbi:unnamed protein product [Ectocarpus sp. CCAP 1310/34]|nr:unnamed protein product [Ectocarpus sp. CCAP 1310/34]
MKAKLCCAGLGCAARQDMCGWRPTRDQIYRRYSMIFLFSDGRLALSLPFW